MTVREWGSHLARGASLVAGAGAIVLAVTIGGMHAQTVTPGAVGIEGSNPDAGSPAGVRPAGQGGSDGAIGPSPVRRVDRQWAAQVAAATDIPLRALLAYASADLILRTEQSSCGLSWNTLAAIGLTESSHASDGGARLLADGRTDKPIRGRALNGNGVAAIPDTDKGVWDGDPVWDRAVGPMQFIPSTWRIWAADGNGDGKADPNQIDDAALAAARYLCASGSMTDQAGWRAAVYTYNRSTTYVNTVAARANRYAALVPR